MKVLVKFRRNWADEFDVYGFKIFDSQTAFDQEVQKVAIWFKQHPGQTLDLYFGTNEGWDFDSFADWFESYTVYPIAALPADWVKDAFPESVNYGYANFMWPETEDEDFVEDTVD